MVEIIQETFTLADSKNRTVGVASALGNALAAMSGSAAESVANQTVTALNDLATDASCSISASSSAGESYGTKRNADVFYKQQQLSLCLHNTTCSPLTCTTLTTTRSLLPCPSCNFVKSQLEW